MSKKFVDWLRYASITQGGGASSGGFFTGPRSRQVNWIHTFSSSFATSGSFLFTYRVRARVRQPPPITELDGTVSGDFFTVLCVGQGFTEDQWMNVYSFSMLRHWLLTYHSVSNGNSTVDTGKAGPLLRSGFTWCHCLKTSASAWFFFVCLFVFHHLQQAGCSAASPSPTPFLMVRLVSGWILSAVYGVQQISSS